MRTLLLVIILTSTQDTAHAESLGARVAKFVGGAFVEIVVENIVSGIWEKIKPSSPEPRGKPSDDQDIKSVTRDELKKLVEAEVARQMEHTNSSEICRSGETSSVCKTRIEKELLDGMNTYTRGLDEIFARCRDQVMQSPAYSKLRYPQQIQHVNKCMAEKLGV